MFGRVQIPAGPPGEALLVPDAAIGTDQARKFVFVVEAGQYGEAGLCDARAGRSATSASCAKD